jgi:uncharacterized membrane protein YjjP (DUF1212 family)
MRDVLAIALRAGQLMLENGANTARIEETVHRLATALGAEWVDVYVTPSGIIATVFSDSDHRTRILRLVRSGIDLSRIAAVLEVSRAAEHGELDRRAVRVALEEIAKQPRIYNRWLTTSAVGLACACLAVLFGGGLIEAAITFVSSALGLRLREWMTHYNLSRLLSTGLTAFWASALALVLSLVLQASAPAAAMTAAAIFMVPGVLLVSSAADLFRGDTLAGLSRAASAALLLIAIAGGLWATLLISGVQVEIGPGEYMFVPLYAPLLAFCAAGGFAVMFDVPRRALVFAALNGALAYACYRFSGVFGVPVGAAAFFGGLTVGVLSEVFARLLRFPTSIFSIPAILPLVPGALAFRALLEFVGNDYTNGIANLIRVLVVIIAIAAGLGTVSSLRRVGHKSAV